MYLNRRTQELPLARILALVALLCAGALQVQEAGHDHWNSSGDSYAQCLVCKTGEATLSSALPLATPAGRAAVAIRQSTLPTLAPLAAPFQARAPPLYS